MAKRRDDYMEMINHPLDTDTSQILEGVIRLTGGSPGFSCFRDVPELLIASTKDCMNRREELNYVLSYGDGIGYKHFRKELAKFLTEEYGTEVLSSDLMSTGGSTYGMAAVGRWMARCGGRAYVTTPIFGGVLSVLRVEFDKDCTAAPMDEQGIDVDALERTLEEATSSEGPFTPTESRPYWGMLVVIPIYDNPTGACLSQERCRKLVKVARRYDLLVVADDIYGLLHYTGDKYPPPRLITYDKKSDPDYKGSVLSIGSFSKILAPGLRMGWIEGPKRILYKICNIPSLSGGSVCHYSSAIITSALRLGLLKKQLYTVRHTYTERMRALVDALRKNLPPQLKFTEPQGGYFVWITLPDKVNLPELCILCEDKFKVSVREGNVFFVGGHTEKKFIRVTFGYYEPEVLVEAVERMCRGIREHCTTMGIHVD